jgi:multidrug transporter EmrE-like cation transporter
MEWVSQWGTWLNDTMVKTILLMVGAAILKKWQPFVNKAIPVAIAVVSALLSTMHALFPAITPATVPAQFAFASFAGIGLEAVANPATRGASWLWNTLAPVAFAIATHSGPKNTAEWIKLRVGVFWPGGRPMR